jgi:hypothetical protein
MGCHCTGGVIAASLDCSDCMAIESRWTYGFIFATQRMSLRHCSQPFFTQTSFTVRYSFFTHNLIHDSTACTMVFNSYVLNSNKHIWVLKPFPAAELLRLQLGCLCSTTRTSLGWRWTARFLRFAIKKRGMFSALSSQMDYCTTGAQTGLFR